MFTLLLLAGLSSGAGAQTEQVLIGNIDQSAGAAWASIDSEQRAQAFTTGGNAGGYTLTSVEVAYWAASSAAQSRLSVTVRSANNSGQPGTSLGTLSTPTVPNGGQHVLEHEATGSGIQLAADTTYFVVWPAVGNGMGVTRVTSAAEDAGGADGWSIADESRFGNSWSNWAGGSLQIRINGKVNATSGVTVSETSLALTELGASNDAEKTYTVVLDTDPTADVTVTVAGADATAIAVDTDTSTDGNQNTLTFTAGGDGSGAGAGNGNWAVAQTVTVRALNDADAVNESFNLTHTATAASGPYDGISINNVAVTTDDAGHGVTVSEARLSIGENDATATYMVVLKSRPSGNVVVSATSGAAATATVMPPTLTFTDTDWNTPHRVTVTGKGPGSTSISHAVSSSGDTTNYPTTTTIPSVMVTVTTVPRLSLNPVQINAGDLNGATITLTPKNLSFLNVGTGGGGGSQTGDSEEDDPQLLTGTNTSGERTFTSAGLALITLVGAPTGLTISSGKVLARQSNVDGFPRHRSAEITLSYSGTAIAADDVVTVTVNQDLLRRYHGGDDQPVVPAGTSLSANFRIKTAAPTLSLSPTAIKSSALNGATITLTPDKLSFLDVGKGEGGGSGGDNARYLTGARTDSERAFSSVGLALITLAGAPTGLSVSGGKVLARQSNVDGFPQHRSAEITLSYNGAAITADDSVAVTVDPELLRGYDTNQGKPATYTGASLSANFTIKPATAGLTVSPTSLALTEQGAPNELQKTYRVRLDTDPGADVTVTATVPPANRSHVQVKAGSAAFGSTATLTFTAGGDGSGAGNGNWAVAQAVTVRALNDEDTANVPSFNINHAATAVGNTAPYHRIRIDPVAVTVTDAGHGVFVSRTSLAVFDGDDTQTYQVALNTPPSGNVVITTSSGDTSKATVSPPTMTFTTANWNRPRTVTVTGKGAGTARVSHTVQSSADSTNYPTSTTIPPVDVTVTADDRPYVFFSSPNYGGFEGKDVVLTVTLSEAAGVDVTVPVTVDSSGRTTASSDDYTLPDPSSVTIPAGERSGTYTIAITADSENEHHELLNLLIEAANLPRTVRLAPGTRGSAISTLVNIGNVDLVTISHARLSLMELGVPSQIEKTYTIVLATDPGADVTVTVTNGDPTAIAVDTDTGTDGNQNTLTFTAGGDGSGSGAGNGNWAVAQTVTVRALNDGDTAGETFNITHSATATGDTAPYHGITIDPVAVDITDTGHGVVVSKSSLPIAENDDTATYTVVLESQPTGNVVISATSSDTANAEVDTDPGMAGNQSTLTFTNADWNTLQPVTVTRKGAGSATISHMVTAATVDITSYPTSTTISTVTVTADTRPTVSLSPPWIISNEGENAEFTLTLSAALGADVTIPMTVTGLGSTTAGDDFTVPDPSSATIAAGETEATFSIAITDDDVIDKRELFRVAIDTDELPKSVRAGTVTRGDVVIEDNDVGVLVSMSAANASVREGESLEVFFELAEALDKDVRIPIVVFGNAADITDPVPADMVVDYTVTIAEGGTTGSVTLTTLQDTLVEGEESGFFVDLPTSDGLALLWSQGIEVDANADRTVVTILDDDLVVLTESSGSTAVNEDGTTDGYEVGLRELHTGRYSPSTVVATAGDGVRVSPAGNTPAASRSMNLSNLTRSEAVHVHAVDDDVDNPGGSRVGRIVHAVNRTSDGVRNAVVDDILVSIIDDDPTTVTLAAAAGGIDEGQTKEFTIALGRGLVDGETLTAPLTFTGTATRGTDYTMTGVSATGVQYNNLDSGSASVVFAGPQSGATATTATITLRATPDSAAESPPETVDIAFGTITNTGLTGAGGVDETDSLAAFTISDPAARGLVITETDGDTTVSEDGTATDTYTVALVSRPTDSVVVTVVAGAGAKVDTNATSPGDQSTLLFTTANWETAQTVTVAGVDDGADNAGSVREVDIRHWTSSDDDSYDITRAGALSARVLDDDPTAVAIAGGGTVAEDGSDSAYITVTLGRALVAGERLRVPLAIGGGATPDVDYTLGFVQGAASTVVSMVFGPGPGDAAVVFTGSDTVTARSATLAVKASDDRVDEGASERMTVAPGAVVSNLDLADPSGAGPGGTSASGSAAVAITDDDEAGVTVSASALSLTAGARHSYTLRLESRPLGTVAITPTSDDPDVAVVEGTEASSSGRVFFNADNWSSPRTVTVVGAGAGTAEVSHAVTTEAGGGYAKALPIDPVPVTVTAAASPVLSMSLTEKDSFRRVTSLDEGGVMTWRLWLRDVSSERVEVDSASLLAVTGDGVTASDYLLTDLPETLVFNSLNSYALSVRVLIRPDAEDEPNERLTFGFGTGFPDTLTRGATGTMTVVDRNRTVAELARADGGTGVVQLTEAGGETVRLTVTLSRALSGSETLTVPIAVSGTGIDAGDYTLALASGNGLNAGVTLNTGNPYSAAQPAVVFSGGARVATLELTGLDDGTAESFKELIEVSPGEPRGNLDEANPATRSTRGATARGVVLAELLDRRDKDDDDGATPAVKVGPPDVLAVEGGADGLYYVWLATDPEGTATVDIAPRSAGVVSVTPARLTFTPDGATAYDQPQAVTVRATPDADTADATVVLDHTVSGYGSVTGAPSVTVSIRDAGAGVVIEAANPLVAAEAGSAGYRVRLLSRPSASVTVAPRLSDSGQVAEVAGAVNFAPNEWNTAKTITVTGLSPGAAHITHAASSGDSAYAALNLPAVSVRVDASRAVADATFTIAADQPNVAAGAGAWFTVGVSPALSGPVSVSVAISGDGVAKGQFATRRARVPAGGGGQVRVSTAPGGGTVTATLPARYDGASASVTVVSPVTVTETAGGTAVAEGGATDSYTVALRTRPEVNVTVTASAGDGLLVRTAADATPAASKTLTFTPANWSEAQAVTVSAADDDIDQPGAARTSAVTHDSSSGQAAFDNLTIAPVEVAITDDDATVVSLAADADAVVGEQQDWDRGSFTVTLARALVSGEALDVPLALVSSSVALPGSASPMIRLSLPHAKGVSLIDAATAAPKVRFTGGVGVAREARVEVIPTRTGDDDSDDDAFTVRLGTLGATSGTGLDGGAAADGSANEAAMTLADDDLFVTVAGAAADEGDPVEFTVTLPRAAPAGGVTVTYATRDGTLRQSDDDDDTPVRRRAVAGADYVRANGATITIAEGGRTGAISVRTVQDSISETDHHFTVLVTATSHFGLRGGLASATGVIRDDADVPAYQFRAATATVDEGATLDAVIERTGDVTTEVLVSLDHAVTGGGAVAGEDFTGGAGTVLFRAGDDEKTVRIPITDDAVNDVGETFTLALSVNDGSVGPATIGTNAGMTVTITDRDPVTVGVTAGADIREGAEAVFTLTSDTEPQNALAVSVGLTQAGGYFASDAPTSLEVTLPAGETSVEFKVATIANAYSVDADGWVGAEVVGGDGYVAAPRPRAGARVSVEDVEHVVGVGADAEEITEGGNAEFTLSVDPAPVADLVVSFDVAQTGDYVASSNLGRKSVTLAKGDTTAAYSVATVNDSATEDAGAVTLSLVAGSGYGVDEGAEDASVTVADDDHPDPEVRIEPVAGEVDEGSAAEFTVRLLGTQSAAVTVSVEVVGTTGYVAAGETGTRQVTVPTSGSATLSVPTAAVVGDTPDGEVTVTANAGSGYRLTGATVPGTVRVADTVATVVSVSGGGTLTEGDPSRTATAVVELSRVLVVGEKVLVPLRFRTAARDFLSGRKSRRDVLVSGSGQGVTLKDPDTQVRSPPNQGNYAVEFSGAGAQRATLTLSARAERSPNDRVDAVVALSLRPLNNDPVTNVGGGLEADSANKGATFTVLDREKAAAAAGVTVSPASLALTELGAANEAEKTYMVALGTDPVADVTITVTNGDATAVEVDTDSGTDGNQDTLTFTAGGDGSGSGAGNGDWAVAQAVTVRALNDADGANESFDITHGATATGDTAPYHGITIAPVAVTTTDAGHGVVVSESALSVAENDGTATYTVVLKSQPSGNVVISATSGAVANATVSPGTLTFTSGDWNRPREVTVTGKGEGSATVSHAVDSSADAASYPTTTSIPDVTVTITDDDGAGLTITETDGSTSVTEASGAGNTDTYTVALRTEPTHDVTVTVTAGTGVQINKTGGTAGTSQTLTFTSGNWSTAQTVTVTGVNDNADNPGGGRDATISHAASSTDANYTIASAGSVGARVTDDDPTTVTLSAAAGNIEEGQTKEFTIALGRGLVDGETLAVPLTFGGTASRGTDYTMTGAAAAGVRYGNLDSGNANVVFTGPESGATATTATITLSATSDSTAESTPETVDIAFGTITNTGLTGAGGVSGTDSLAEFNISDPLPGAGVTVSTGSLALTELGAANAMEKAYTLVLDTDPGADVTITVTNGDGTAVEVDTDSGTSGNQSALTFTAGGDGSGSGAANGNWAVAQTVTVRALNDGDAANESFNLTHSAAVSDTGNPYHDITIDPVVVTITDAGHGIIVSKSMLSVAENDETATYTAALKSQPSGNVVISATSGATATAEVDTDAGMAGNQNTLTFTNADWKTPQTVTVTGKGAGSTSITHAVASSADTAGYPADGSLSLDSVSVEVTRGPINLEIQVTDAYEGEDIVVTLKLSRALGGSSTAAQRRFQVSSFAPNAAAMTYCKNNAICDSTDAAAVAADFTVRNQVGVTFGPNETTQTFRFATATDNTVEPREVAGVVIRQYVGSGGLIATSSGRDRSLRAPVIASGLTQIYSHGFIDDGARPVAGLTLTETSGGTEVSEDGTTLTDTYDIALNTEPTHDVTVTATAGAGAQVAAGGAAASTATLTFTSGNWNMAQAITVTGVDDNIDNAGGARTVAISHAATSTDTDYRIDPAGSVGVTVTDDDATTVTLARAGSGGIAEDGGTEDITITLGRALVAGESVTVPLAVTGATAATHYTIGLKGSGGTGVTIDTSNPHSAGNPAVILAGAGAQVATLILTAVDTSDTNRRTVDIAFGTNSRAPSHTGLSGGIRTAGSASVPINDDDAVVTVADASAAEGGAVVFTVSLPENAPSGGVTVGYSTANGRGESTDAAYQVATGDDYTAAAQNAAITIAAGAGTGTISIATRQDTTYEGDHHFTLTLDSTSFFNIDATANSAIGTITDAADTPSFEFSATSSAVAESVGTLSLTVEKTGTTLVPATVTYETVDDTATGGSDFTAIAATDLVFAAGDTGKTVTVTITDDSNDELSETFSVDLAAKAHARLGTDAIHDVTITDNDPTPVTLSATNTAIAEDGGAKTITVRLGRALTGSETLSVALTFSGDATFGTDYTLAGPETAPTGVTYSNLASTDLAMNPPTIAFSGAANAASSATLTLTAGDDATDEGASESVSLGLGTLTAANLDGGASGSGAPTFDITDDDDAPGSIRLSTDVTSIAEDAATATVTVTATVTGDSAYNTATTVAVEVGDAGDSATEGIDYANVAGFDITIAAGAMSGQGNFSLDPTDDSLDEDNESIRVKGTSGSLGITGTSISLTDDDDPPEISVDAPSVDEGASGANATLRFTVSLDAASGREVTVAYAETTGGTATQDTDYAALAGDTLTFDAGETSKHIDITVTGDDIDEDNETVKVQLSSPGNATLFGGKATLDATGTITDDDDAPTVSVANATAVTEGNDPKTTVDMRFAVTLSAASSRTVTVPYTLGGSATKDDDYTAPNPTSLTISAGSTSADIVVPVKGDELDEANETITVALGTPTNATISTTQGAGTATGTITDDESTPTATLILTPASIAESGASNVSTVTASLSGASDQAVTLAVAAAAVSPAKASDFALSSDTTLTIAAGSRSSTGTVTITAVDNNVDAANKSVTVSATASGGRGVANPASATLTITDDDDAPTGIALSVDPTSVAEDAGTTAIQVTASTTGSATYSTARTLAVTVGGGASTATSGTDHTAVTGFSMVLPAGTSSVAQSFNLEPLDDRVDEDSETIQVAGTTIGATISPATITLTDNDTKGVTVTGSSLTVLEADDTGTGSTREDQATYTVVLDSQPTADVTITISAGSAVTVSPTSLTFTPSGAGIWSTAQTVTVTAVDDDIDNSGDARSAGITHTVAAGVLRLRRCDGGRREGDGHRRRRRADGHHADHRHREHRRGRGDEGRQGDRHGERRHHLRDGHDRPGHSGRQRRQRRRGRRLRGGGGVRPHHRRGRHAGAGQLQPRSHRRRARRGQRVHQCRGNVRQPRHHRYQHRSHRRRRPAGAVHRRAARDRRRIGRQRHPALQGDPDACERQDGDRRLRRGHRRHGDAGHRLHDAALRHAHLRCGRDGEAHPTSPSPATPSTRMTRR